jgi:hypothetical protein
MGEGIFDAGGTPFLIDGHSDAEGTTREPHRYLINFFAEAEVEALAGEMGRDYASRQAGWRQDAAFSGSSAPPGPRPPSYLMA